MPTIDLNDKIQRKQTLLDTAINDETVLMDVQKDEYYGLDDIASAVWHLLAQPTTAAQIITILIQRYDGEPEIIRRDTLALLQNMAERDLLDLG
ncbi:PqqD family protein [Ferrovibrio sp.]|uniref:PqqD family protein n=1 Tax=Ferrovibrio sp. TaxID=1917215 RepID=UPI001B6FC4D2|nr:PqqD family protein [Ferrovibrio sp.]MBP7063921.1 PqqD family protein [Ferrovibrio sp.]